MKLIKRCLIGRNTLDIGAIWQSLWKRNQMLDTQAIGAIDVALALLNHKSYLVVRNSWLLSLLARLARVLVHVSLPLAIALQKFPRGGLVFSACLVVGCGCAWADSVLERGAAAS